MPFTKPGIVSEVAIELTHPLYFDLVTPKTTEDDPHPVPVRVAHRFVFVFRRMTVNDQNKLERETLFEDGVSNLDRLAALCTEVKGFDDFPADDRALPVCIREYFTSSNPVEQEELDIFVNAAVNGYMRSVFPTALFRGVPNRRVEVGLSSSGD